MNVLDKKIILASKSPRRSQLLREAGFQFEIKTKETPEDFPDELPVEEVAAYLARKKALAAKSFLENGKVLLAADTIVTLDQEIFGKPTDAADARRILRALSGKEHLVITGVCLLSTQQEKTFSGVSKVFMDELTAEEIDYYIEQFQPYDKAGAYAIQEWIGLNKISKIEGSYVNIMGLPVQMIYQALQSFKE
ncbi:MAG: Maf family nucleotide pyrophosphatase [Saprospiraceae bacterium]